MAVISKMSQSMCIQSAGVNGTKFKRMGDSSQCDILESVVQHLPNGCDISFKVPQSMPQLLLLTAHTPCKP